LLLGQSNVHDIGGSRVGVVGLSCDLNPAAIHIIGPLKRLREISVLRNSEMSYDVHIVRTNDWLDAVADPITKLQVDEIVASDPDLAWSTAERDSSS
jgi:hypothetical protein